MQQCQILILGEAGVGTRALCCRFASDFFPEDYDPVIEDLYEKQVSVNGEKINIQLYDVAGQEEYFSLHDYHAQKSEGFLLTYSITSRNSFQRIRDLHHTILRNKPREMDIPIVLLANKCDLSGEREVPTIEGEVLAQKMGWDFFETSAKDKTNVDMAFVRLVERVRRDQKGDSPSPCPSSPTATNQTEDPVEDMGAPGCKLCVIM